LPFERFKAIDKYKDGVSKLFETSVRGESSIEKRNSIILPAAAEQITAEEMNKTLDNIKSSLGEGGIGVGVPIGYLPKSNPTGLYKVFQLAGELNALVFTHVRNPDIISIQEVIAAAALTNAPLHIVHINSMALGNIQLGLYMVNAAQKRGIDITAELYPYTAV
jgi:dihydroorotase-like cyclic amidohydrolase